MDPEESEDGRERDFELWNEIQASRDAAAEALWKRLQEVGPQGVLWHLREGEIRHTCGDTCTSTYDGDPWCVLAIMARDDVGNFLRSGGCDFATSFHDLPGFILATTMGGDGALGYTRMFLSQLWHDIDWAVCREIAELLVEKSKHHRRYPFILDEGGYQVLLP